MRLFYLQEIAMLETFLMVTLTVATVCLIASMVDYSRKR